MATLGATYLNIMDLVQRENKDHTVATVAEILNQKNPISMAFRTCNDGTQNITHVRTKLPTASLLSVGGGVPLDKSNVSPITDITSRIGVASEVSKRVIDLNGNMASHRANEAKADIEALNQKAANLWFYGNATTGIPTTADPLSFDGLAKRYGLLSGGNAEQIIDAGGTGTDNTSIYMVINGPRAVSGLVPLGAGVGIKHTPLNGGVAYPKTLSSGNVDEFYGDTWEWHLGMCVEDWRSVVRICNIGVSNLVSESGAADLIKLMIKGQHRLEPAEGLGTPEIYVSRTLAQMLDIQSLNKQNGNLTAETVDGKRKLSFRGYAVKTIHALKDDEARVV